jgi:prevent-host-death family protein
VQSPNVKGNVAELAIAKAAAELGLSIYAPLVEHSRADLVLEIADTLYRVQCKWGRLLADRSVIYVQTGGNRTTPAGYVRTVYSRAEIDLMAVYCGDLDRAYLLPAEVFEGRHAIHLRLTEPRNGQRASINAAAKFEFHGAVAQLARASGWQPEGRGFESPQLHSPSVPESPVVVGANEFRNRFGWYMERAAAGEEFHVERRGRPYVRLTAAAATALATSRSSGTASRCA